MQISHRLGLVLVTLSLVGCPGPAAPPPGTDSGGGTDTGGAIDGGSDGGSVGVDAGMDAGTTDLDGGGGGTDAGTGTDAPAAMADTGVSTAWTDCREAVVFGEAGEACSFTGSCVECALVASPRQVLCMSGRLRVAAAGAGACAGGSDAGVFVFPDGGPAPDAGVGVDGGGVCPPYAIPDPTGGVCAASTVDCIRAGTDPATCIRADATCLTCAQQEIQACATRMGCDDEAGRAVCCFNANCPDQSCYATTCATDWNAYAACVQASSCTISDLCFPSAPACPAATWPAPTEPGCSATTRACVEAATTGAALEACLDADTTGTPGMPAGAACNSCVQFDLLACATDPATPNACDDELGLVECCLETACPTGEATCRQNAVGTGGSCATPWDTFVDCANTAVNAGDCGLTTACFP